jgi:hypothetical protein
MGSKRMDPGQRVRLLPLMSDGQARAGTMAGEQGVFGACTVLPRVVWGSSAPLYVALEVYLREPGEGEPRSWEFARKLVRCVLACGEARRAGA